MARYPRAQKIYEVAELFAQECLMKDDSLLFPGTKVWTLENLNRLWSALVENPDIGSEDYMTKLTGQLGGQPEDVIRMMAEATAFYCLFPHRSSLGTVRKRELVEEVLTLSPTLPEPDSERWRWLLKAFESEGIGSTGTGYNTARDNQISFVLAFAKTLKENEIGSLAQLDPEWSTDTALEMVRKIRNHRPFASFNIMRHLIWPDSYEGTASSAQKDQMAKNLSSHFDLPELDNDDATILQARTHMEADNFEVGFNMYDVEIRKLWDFKPITKKRTKKEKTLDREPISPPKQETSVSSTITDLATETHLTKPFLLEIKGLLLEKKQLIFEGPPGSGKTFVAEKFARYITGQSLNDSERNEQVEIIQFHQSYSYEDFVEGIRPETNEDGQLIYDVKKGIFREFADKAMLNPNKKFVLIIDEINRGNVSRILGELMLLLEYRDQTATLQYSQDALQVPPNLYIIGTMNTADRSLSQIDYALRRRFYFVRFMAVENGEAPVLRGWLQARGIDHSEPVALFVRLNQRIRQLMHTDDLQVGHSYFMRKDIDNPQVLNQVWTYAVMPLLREYFYHQRDRDSLLVGFELAQLNTQPDGDNTNVDTVAIDADDV